MLKSWLRPCPPVFERDQLVKAPHSNLLGPHNRVKHSHLHPVTGRAYTAHTDQTTRTQGMAAGRRRTDPGSVATTRTEWEVVGEAGFRFCVTLIGMRSCGHLMLLNALSQ